MTFSEIKQELKSRLNLTSTEADLRLGVAVNRHYKRVTASIGMDSTRPVTVSTTTAAVQTVTFAGVEKIDRVLLIDGSTVTPLEEVSLHRIRLETPSTDQPRRYAVQTTGTDSVTILLDTIPAATATLHADGQEALSNMTADGEPAFPQSYHDILTWFVMSEELLRKEKPQLAEAYEVKANELLKELRWQMADSPTRVTRQGQWPRTF